MDRSALPNHFVQQEVVKLVVFYKGCLKHIFVSMHDLVNRQHCSESMVVKFFHHALYVGVIGHSVQLLTRLDYESIDSKEKLYHYLQHNLTQKFQVMTAREIEAYWRQYFCDTEDVSSMVHYLMQPMMKDIFSLLNYYLHAHHEKKAEHVSQVLSWLSPGYYALLTQVSGEKVKSILHADIKDILLSSPSVQKLLDHILMSLNQNMMALSQPINFCAGSTYQPVFDQYTVHFLSHFEQSLLTDTVSAPLLREMSDHLSALGDRLGMGCQRAGDAYQQCLADGLTQSKEKRTLKSFCHRIDERNVQLLIAAGMTCIGLQLFQVVADFFLIPLILAAIALLAQAYDILYDYYFSRSKLEAAHAHYEAQIKPSLFAQKPQALENCQSNDVSMQVLSEHLEA